MSEAITESELDMFLLGQVLQRLPHSLFEAAARKLCKRSAALSVEECHQYKVWSFTALKLPMDLQWTPRSASTK